MCVFGIKIDFFNYLFFIVDCSFIKNWNETQTTKTILLLEKTTSL